MRVRGGGTRCSTRLSNQCGWPLDPRCARCPSWREWHFVNCEFAVSSRVVLDLVANSACSAYDCEFRWRWRKSSESRSLLWIGRPGTTFRKWQFLWADSCAANQRYWNLESLNYRVVSILDSRDSHIPRAINVVCEESRSSVVRELSVTADKGNGYQVGLRESLSCCVTRADDPLQSRSPK
jgi:hypothetical protein